MRKNADCGPKLISGRELARRLGVDEKAVRKAVQAGRISPASTDERGRKMYIEATARREWEKNTLPEKRTGRQAVSKTHDLPATKMNPNEARAARDSAQARILTFKAKTLEQELIGCEDVSRLWERHVGEAKRLFLTLPAELRMLIPALTSDNIALIENRIIVILDTLSAWRPGEKA